jgi:hypothetical protein
MNPRCPLVTLTIVETKALRELVVLRGEKVAVALVGLRSAEAYYKAASGAPVARLTAEVIRGRLDRI